MIQRMSDQHRISFLDGEKSSEKSAESKPTPEKTLKQLSEEQKSKKLSSNFDIGMTSKHISSARTGDISDMGGPSTFTKSESANTIWDANKNAKAAESMDNKTKTLKDKEEIASNKREAENERMNDLVDTLKSTIQDKASSISSAGTLSGTNYKVSKNNMSIFDNQDFMRLTEKTGGEKISDDLKERKGQVDDSWRDGGKVVSSKDVTKKMFDGFFTKPE